MRFTISAVRRSDGTIDYAKHAPTRTMRTEVLAVFEKLEAQLQANGAIKIERENFIRELNEQGMAVVSIRK